MAGAGAALRPFAFAAARAATPLDRVWQAAFRVGFPLARRWWRFTRRPHVGALVAVRVGESLLLLRSSYRREWNFPGGGVQRGEAPEAAARRELAEEIGLSAGVLRHVGTTRGIWDGRPDSVHLFELWLEALPPLRLDNREIVEARLVRLDEIAGLAVTGPVASYLRLLRGR